MPRRSRSNLFAVEDTGDPNSATWIGECFCGATVYELPNGTRYEHGTQKRHICTFSTQRQKELKDRHRNPPRV